MSHWSDLAVWRGPSPHRYAGGMVNGGRSRGLVAHIASGFYDGTIAWQLDAAAADPTSSHFVIARDGRIAQMLEIEDASWAQEAGNRTWHSVEFEGFAADDPLHASHPGWERLTEAQIVAAARLYGRGHRELGWPLQLASSPVGAGLGHHSMGVPDWGHAFCPGDPVIGQKAAILACAQQPGPTPPPHPTVSEEDPVLFEVPKAVALHRDGSWADPTNAAVLPLFEVGQAGGQWGDAWVRLASTGPATVRVVANGGGWNGTTVDLGFADGGTLVPLPQGTTVVYVGRVEGDPLTADVTGAVRYAPKP